MRAGNSGDADSYRRLLLQLTPVLRAVAEQHGVGRAGRRTADGGDGVPHEGEIGQTGGALLAHASILVYAPVGARSHCRTRPGGGDAGDDTVAR